MQGDYERQEGKLPVPIMNRYQEDEQALHQVNNISYNIHNITIFHYILQGGLPGWYLYPLLLPALHPDAHRDPDVGAVQAEPHHLAGVGRGEEERNEEIKLEIIVNSRQARPLRDILKISYTVTGIVPGFWRKL